MPKLMIRIKRKSSASFTDTDDETASSEKRPKVGFGVYHLLLDLFAHRGLLF
jgi:hypothetical protein